MLTRDVYYRGSDWCLLLNEEFYTYLDLPPPSMGIPCYFAIMPWARDENDDVFTVRFFTQNEQIPTQCSDGLYLGTLRCWKISTHSGIGDNAKAYRISITRSRQIMERGTYSFEPAPQSPPGYFKVRRVSENHNPSQQETEMQQVPLHASNKTPHDAVTPLFMSTYTGASSCIVTGAGGLDYLRQAGFFPNEATHGLEVWASCNKGEYKLFPYPVETESDTLTKRKFKRQKNEDYRLSLGNPAGLGPVPLRTEKAFWKQRPVDNVEMRDVDGRSVLTLERADDQWCCTRAEVEKSTGKIDPLNIEFHSDVHFTVASENYRQHYWAVDEDLARLVIKVLEGRFTEKQVNMIKAVVKEA